MRKIINGRSYDTTTAAMVGCKVFCGEYVTDLCYCDNCLYRKRTGEYFLSATSCGSETIKPLAYAEADEWARRNLDADEYEAEFGSVPEGGETVQVGVRLPSAVARKLARAASETGRTQTEIVCELIDSL